MERSNKVLIAAAALAFSAGSLAQQQPAPRAAPPTGQAQELQLSDADLEKFADIYVDLLETQGKFEQELGSAETEEEARDVQARIQIESVEKLTRHGWTAERYVLVGEAIRSDPTLTEKTLALIDDRD
jgi:uncharacterized protein HemX